MIKVKIREKGVNEIPMTALGRSIEIDLREMLGEKDIPGRVSPVKNTSLS